MMAMPQVCLSYALLNEGGGTASSDEGKRVTTALISVNREFHNSVFLSGNIQAAVAQACTLAARATADNWDGAEGSKISNESFELTLGLLGEMHRDWPSPDLDIDEDGDMSLEWVIGPSRRLSVSVGSGGRLSYAWMIPGQNGETERNYGVASSQGSFPATVTEAIQRLCA